MNVLIIGSGAREHAFCWKIKDSKILKNLYVAPGNAGTEKIAENLEISTSNFLTIKKTLISKNINLLIIGPEIPLIDGLTDFVKNDLALKEILVIGPSKLGSTLEGSKDFSKEFMLKHKVPTAPYKTFDSSSVKAGLDYLATIPHPMF